MTQDALVEELKQYPNGGGRILGRLAGAASIHIERQASRIAELESEVARLREALEPFAEDCRKAGFPNSIPDTALLDDVDCGNTELTVGDFRRAQEALRHD